MFNCNYFTLLLFAWFYLCFVSQRPNYLNFNQKWHPSYYIIKTFHSHQNSAFKYIQYILLKCFVNPKLDSNCHSFTAGIIWNFQICPEVRNCPSLWELRCNSFKLMCNFQVQFSGTIKRSGLSPDLIHYKFLS